ncbi:MAG: thiolase family protein [Candidatus Aenigmarchaeota archaeon]|nr:thiolase family protein [Candidatus Aenigmarchaeota archaeon]
MSEIRKVVIVDGTRTPFGAFNGAFRKVSAIELAAHAIRGLLAKTGIPKDQVDHVILGNALQTSSDAIYLARHAALKAGLPVETPAVTVNRLCGSGLEAIVQGARLILAGEAKVVIAGGTENMTQAPFVLRGARDGLRLGSQKLEDSLWEALYDPVAKCTMAGTANNLARKFGISRKEQDEFALRSQQLATNARNRSRFVREIIEVPLPGKQQSAASQDEHIKPGTTYEALAALPLASFPADSTPNEFVTAGNASGICDGAAVVLLAAEEMALSFAGQKLASIKGWATVGVEPKEMGSGPVPAICAVLKQAGMCLSEIDLIEINEAFAGQTLATAKALKIREERLNVNGGAIALGHPLGASGARLALTLGHELAVQKKQFGIASLCIGGGQGIAAILEAV